MKNDYTKWMPELGFISHPGDGATVLARLVNNGLLLAESNQYVDYSSGDPAKSVTVCAIALLDLFPRHGTSVGKPFVIRRHSDFAHFAEPKRCNCRCDLGYAVVQVASLGPAVRLFGPEGTNTILAVLDGEIDGLIFGEPIETIPLVQSMLTPERINELDAIRDTARLIDGIKG